MSKRKRKPTKSEKLRKKELRREASEKFASMSHNELAEKLRAAGDKFLASPEWKALRRKVIQKFGGRCLCCGRTPRNPSHINVDHIKPRRYFPELALEEDNLQVLCGACNKRKGNADTDYRQINPWDGPVHYGEYSDESIGRLLKSL